MASNNANKYQNMASGIQDPTDFPENSAAPGLRSLDNILRCPICSEFFDGPVTLKCGHCFCSVCIRQSLLVKQECPTCRQSDVNEAHVRINPAMEEVVSAWKLSRPFILQLLVEKRRRNTPARPTKKRKISGHSDDEIICIPSSNEADVTSSSSRPPVLSQDAKNLAYADEDFSDENDEVSATQPDDFVKCPSCSKRIQLKDINNHLDRGCDDEQGQTSKSQWANILGANSRVGKASKRKGKERASSEDDDESPLPKKSYDTLKDKAIREILQEQGLPTNGDRSTMIARHERWVVIYNANLDKSKKLRKSPDALRRELRQWETQQKVKTKHDISDPVAYQKKQKSEFDRLVEAARLKKPVSNGVASTVHEAKDHTSRPSSPVKQISAIIIDSEEDPQGAKM